MDGSWAVYGALGLAFLKIGAVGFGGGYAMLPLVRHEVVEAHGWIDAGGFTDLVAISQMTPGPIMANAATYIGYTAAAGAGGGGAWPGVAGLTGALLATAAVSAIPFLLMWLICRYFHEFRHHPRVQGALRALRPVVLGMMAAAALSLMNPVESGTTYGLVMWCVIFAAAFWLAAFRRWHPIPLLLLSGLAGYFVS